MYKITVESRPEGHLTLKTLGDGELAIVTEGEFSGELFYKNVMGLHSISGNRYWPSDYASHAARSGLGFYRGPEELKCKRVVPGDTLRIRE